MAASTKSSVSSPSAPHHGASQADSAAAVIDELPGAMRVKVNGVCVLADLVPHSGFDDWREGRQVLTLSIPPSAVKALGLRLERCTEADREAMALAGYGDLA